MPDRRIIKDTERAELRAELRHSYEGGRTIRQLCETHDLSYGRVHTLLTEAKTVMRSRGGSRAR